MSRESMNRRDFVKATAGVVASGLAVPVLGGQEAPRASTAASKARVLGANERIRIGCIGVGGMGGGHLRSLVRNSTTFNCEVVAVCDLFSKRRDYAAQHAACQGYVDYREVLARDDVDAVVIATPDHWHAPITIDAMKAGKDVYCEKPMTYMAEEALEVLRTQRETDAVVQIGTQYTSEDQYWRARQAIADGRIGKVVWAQTAFSRNSRGGEWNYYAIDPDGNEKTIDWTRFLGNRPKIPFHAERFFRWRKYWDYSGGVATDLFFHRLAPMLLAIGPSFPLRVTAGGGIWIQKQEREVPDTFFTLIDYPDEFSVTILATMNNAHPTETAIRGQYGTILLDQPGQVVRIKGEGDWMEEFKKLNGGAEQVDEKPLTSEDFYMLHMKNFMECVRTRNAPNCDARLGAMTMAAVAASVKAFRENRVVTCDPATGRLS